MISFLVPNDLYLVPSEEDGNFILYRPSKHLAALVRPEKVRDLVATVKTSQKKFLTLLESKCLSKLVEAGFLDAYKNDKLLGLSNQAEHHDIPNSFSPHEVMLDITRKCNMRCIYCYSCGGDTVATMSHECGCAAIDLCVSNAKRKGVSFFGLHFHGGGEPSQEFELLTELYEYSKKRCDEIGIAFKCSVITNGLIPPNVVDFYSKHMDEITLSLDGDQSSQDQQRPSSSGRGTFERVFKVGKLFLEFKKKINIRMTVTAKNVARLEAIVKFLIFEFPGCPINLESVTLVGRALNREDLVCDSILFADRLFNCMKIGITLGATIFYSGVSGHSQRKEFCAASAPSFCVCADGSVTSCFSYSQRDVVKDLFVYGRYNGANKTFQFDYNAIKRLQTLTMEHDRYCDQCFCRTHCIGDCPAIRKFDLTSKSEFIEKIDRDFMLNRRCATNRRIVVNLLNDILRGRISYEPFDYRTKEESCSNKRSCQEFCA